MVHPGTVLAFEQGAGGVDEGAVGVRGRELLLDSEEPRHPEVEKGGDPGAGPDHEVVAHPREHDLRAGVDFRHPPAEDDVVGATLDARAAPHGPLHALRLRGMGPARRIREGAAHPEGPGALRPLEKALAPDLEPVGVAAPDPVAARSLDDVLRAALRERGAGHRSAGAQPPPLRDPVRDPMRDPVRGPVRCPGERRAERAAHAHPAGCIAPAPRPPRVPPRPGSRRAPPASPTRGPAARPRAAATRSAPRAGSGGEGAPPPGGRRACPARPRR